MTDKSEKDKFKSYFKLFYTIKTQPLEYRSFYNIQGALFASRLRLQSEATKELAQVSKRCKASGLSKDRHFSRMPNSAPVA